MDSVSSTAESLFTTSQISSAAISRQPIRRACSDCRDWPTTNFPRSSLSKRVTKAMRSTRSATSRLTKIPPKCQATLRTHTSEGGRCQRTTKADPSADWAYAKRALARGDDPEVVIQPHIGWLSGGRQGRSQLLRAQNRCESPSRTQEFDSSADTRLSRERGEQSESRSLNRKDL